MNEISKSAHIIGDVKLGKGNFVSPGATIIGPISIGNDNYFGPNCVIGTPPQDDVVSLKEHAAFTMGFRKNFTPIAIGDANVFREFSTIHQGLTSTTSIGDNCYVMSYSHIAHDCLIESGVKIANSVQMGGYTSILRGSYIGLGAILHQFTVVGGFSMIGMGSIVNKNSIPAGLSLGSPARTIRTNQVALQKYGILEFDWVEEYLKDPSQETIHNALRDDFSRYLVETEKRNSQRKEVSEFRSSLDSIRKI